MYSKEAYIFTKFTVFNTEQLNGLGVKLKYNFFV